MLPPGIRRPSFVLRSLFIAGWILLAACGGTRRDPSRPSADGASLGCSIEGPSAVEEGERLTLGINCPGVPARVLRFDELPAGARYDTGSGVLHWTPGLDQAGVYRLTPRLTGPLGDSPFKSVMLTVLDRFDHPGNTPLPAPRLHQEEAGIPVLHLSVNGDMDGDRYTRATVTSRGRVYAASVKLRGRSSASYPKRNYTLKFARSAPFDEPTAAGGFRRKRKVVLITSFDDNSHIRHRLSFELWNRLAPRLPIQHYTAVVYVNGEFQGLYTVADAVDGPFMEEHGFGKGAAVYKAVAHEFGFFLNEIPPGSVEKKSGRPGDRDIRALWRFVVRSEPEAFRAKIRSWIDLDDAQKWLLLVFAIQASDSYGKNTYLVRSAAGGPFHLVPWDFNASFGQIWDTQREGAGADLSAVTGMNNLVRRLLDDPVLGAETKRVCRVFLDGPLARAEVHRLVETLADEVRIGALRDERRWRAEYEAFSRWRHRKDFTDFEGEVARLHRWIDERWDVLDKIF
jgi:hypothetical protein